MSTGKWTLRDCQAGGETSVSLSEVGLRLCQDLAASIPPAVGKTDSGGPGVPPQAPMTSTLGRLGLQ